MNIEVSVRPERSESNEGPLKMIGQVAEEFKVSNRTLRFYDQIGLVTPVRKNGIRYYSAADIKRIADIMKYQQAGMTLAQIRNVLDDDLGWVKEVALNRTDIEGMISRLRVRREEINDAIQEFEAILMDDCTTGAQFSRFEARVAK
ncbi:MerR family transcriptional regulator [Rhodoblastus acidophilus]|uniref:MerR family transcriptional regulator n=1 Tax=Rhodoblastus acidophilus TaxID=1074 RepID=A0A6N8DMP4_RHOAC|nr:MerR family transcriptional regulator [Rhodoblastus acidophilus]MCW2275697.1 DNA-binding transcriptional MerR regulator [Rhodoblastus acidophilus]MTV31862.1 MerR family transcriptional regulator [Rhodoblastus acidophilus]